MRNLTLSLLLGVLLIAGCDNTSKTTKPSSSAMESQSASSTEGPYLEIKAEGRIYVLGSTKLIQKNAGLKAGQAPHLPYTKTFLGLGPNGETVVLENAKKGAQLKTRLLKTFCQQHPSKQPACAM